MRIRMNYDFTIDLIEDEPGGWLRLETKGVCIFRGYDGENFLTVHAAGMQNGTIDFLVVHESIDSPIQFHHFTARYRSVGSGQPQTCMDTLNEQLHQAIIKVMAR